MQLFALDIYGRYGTLAQNCSLHINIRPMEPHDTGCAAEKRVQTHTKHQMQDCLYRARLRQGLSLYTTRLVRELAVPFKERICVRYAEDVQEILTTYFDDKDREELVSVLLDGANSIIGIALVSIGGLSSNVAEPAQVFKSAILANAHAIILAHNHPSGNPIPSAEDLMVTRRLYAAGRILGIPVYDHLIVGEKACISLCSLLRLQTSSD